MEKRRNAIEHFINQRGNVSFAQLKEAFPKVSEMTLRTDLKALDESRRIVRVYGGAKSVNMVIGSDGVFGQRATRNAEEKEQIAKKAVSLLRPNTTFYIDSGSTTTAFARQIPDESYLIFTNAISCVTELARLKTPRIMMPGGALNRDSMSICGYQGIQEMKQINFDQMFLGVTSYSDSVGFSCGVEEENALKRAVMEQSEEVIVLMDSSKIGLRSTYTIGALSDVDAIVSDGHLPSDFLEACQKYDVTVY